MSLQTTVVTTAPAVSLLPQYASAADKRRRERKAAAVTAIVIDDPYAFHDPAVLREPPRKAQTRSAESSEWIAPAKKPIEVLASRRDVIAGMFARGQIDKAMFLAARDYERTFATAMALPVKTIDPAAPVVSGGSKGNDSIDAVSDASDRLARAEARVAKWHGAEAMAFCREVLGRGLTIERAAKQRGDGDKQRVAWWGGTLRRCLEVLAEASGYAVAGAYRNRKREEKRLEDIRKRQERKDRERRGNGKR